MRDKRPVDELSIEELERILAIRKREARQAQARLQRYESRRVALPNGGTSADDASDEANNDPASVGVFFESDLVQPPNPIEAEQATETITHTADLAMPSAPPVPSVPPPLSSASAARTDPSPAEVPAGLSDADAPDRPQAMLPAAAHFAQDPVAPRFEDDLPRARRPQAEPRSMRKVLWNRALLAIEVAAVIGFVVLLVALFTSVQSLTQTTAQIQAEAQATIQALQVPPTATPTINIAQLVLPGGHLYDEQSATARLNLDEIPAQYRDAFQQAALAVVNDAPPTQSPQAPLNIRIPAINVYSPIVAGDGWAELQRGVGHHLGSANPGERGNMVLVAHNDVFGEIFKDLEKLQPGDKIYVTTQSKEYVYVVRSEEIVLPTEVRVLDNTQRNVSQVTLITCHPYRVDTHRYIVVAELETS